MLHAPSPLSSSSAYPQNGIIEHITPLTPLSAAGYKDFLTCIFSPLFIGLHLFFAKKKYTVQQKRKRQKAKQSYISGYISARTHCTACFLLGNEWEQRNIYNGPNAAVRALLSLIYFSQQLCTTLHPFISKAYF